MAKKPVFGVSPDSFNESRLVDTHTHEHTDTHTHTHNHTQECVVKKTKRRRIQILTYDDLVDEIDAYAKRSGLSRAEVFEAGMRKYMSEVNK